jgi:hypothetical protein
MTLPARDGGVATITNASNDESNKKNASTGRTARSFRWGVMSPTIAAFLRNADPATVRETARLMLVLAALLEAAGRRSEAGAAIGDGLSLLDHAAGLGDQDGLRTP